MMRRWERTIRAVLQHGADDALDAVFDARCPGCGGPIDRASRVCDACDAAIARTGRTLCLRCLRGDPAPESAQRICARHGPERLLLAGPRFEPPLDRIFHAFKYDGAWRLSAWLASLLPEPPGRDGALWKEYVLVPVPLHPARLAKRGFDQCALLAGEASRSWGIPIVSALARVRDGIPQARRAGPARRANLAGDFRLAEPALVAGRAVLLLDDVATTGSTLLAAADALEEAAPTWILGICAAHAGDPAGAESAPDAAVAGSEDRVLEYHARQIGAGLRPPRT